MGSTSTALDKGGKETLKNYTMTQMLQKETATDRLASGLYSLFIPMEWNYEGFIDSYGLPVFDTPKKEVKDLIWNKISSIGVIEHWENEVEGLKERSLIGLNEFYRQFPSTTEAHAFRDEV